VNRFIIGISPYFSAFESDSYGKADFVMPERIPDRRCRTVFFGVMLPKAA